MEELNNESNYICAGCGYELQTEYEEKLGYIPKISNEKINYCKRCYNMIFRNEKPTISLLDEDYWKLFKEILAKDELYVLVLDIFNLEGSIIERMIEELKDKKVILVLNKRDLLPKLVSEDKLKENISNHFLLRNLNTQDIIITSSKKRMNIDLLLDSIARNSKDNNVYLIGSANVGKSSLVNTLINSVLGENTEYISTSYYAGTTLGLINIPLNEKKDLIDTPGIINNSDITTKFSKEILEVIIPKKEIRVRTYQLTDQQTLFISGFCQLDYIEGQRQGFSIYVSNAVDIHRTKYTNSDMIRENNLGKGFLFPPGEKDLEKLSFVTHEITINQNNTDLVIEGLGWINFKNISQKLKLKLTILEDAKYYLRKNLI